MGHRMASRRRQVRSSPLETTTLNVTAPSARLISRKYFNSNYGKYRYSNISGAVNRINSNAAFSHIKMLEYRFSHYTCRLILSQRERESGARDSRFARRYKCRGNITVPRADLSRYAFDTCARARARARYA